MMGYNILGKMWVEHSVPKFLLLAQIIC